MDPVATLSKSFSRYISLPRYLILRSLVLSRPLRQLLIFAVVIVMQWSVAVCPMGVYLLKHLIHFVIDTKTC
jgi:hypothetical protein